MSVKTYKYKQWKLPVRLMYNGWGITVWKWCGIYIPLFSLWFGNYRRIGFDIFHNGSGIVIDLMPVLSIKIATKGKIGWWLKRSTVRLYSKTFKFHFEL